MAIHFFFYSIEWISDCAVYGRYLRPGRAPGFIVPRRRGAAVTGELGGSCGITSEERARMVKVDKRRLLAMGLCLTAFSGAALADSLDAQRQRYQQIKQAWTAIRWTWWRS